MSNLFETKRNKGANKTTLFRRPYLESHPSKSFAFSRCNWIGIMFLVLHQIPFIDEKKLTKTLTWKLSMFRWHLIKNAVIIPELQICWRNADGIHVLSFQRRLIIIIIFMQHMAHFYEHANEFHLLFKNIFVISVCRSMETWQLQFIQNFSNVQPNVMATEQFVNDGTR